MRRKKTRALRLEKFYLPVIIFFFLVIGNLKLYNIPAEWFGDISIVNNYVRDILAGNWPFRFITSQGPIYYYLISPIVYLFGASFLVYKRISVFFGAIGLIFIYLFSKQFSSKRVALIATFITAFSFWYLVWSRIGYNILSPILVALTVWLFMMYVKTNNDKFILIGAISSSLGLFTYANVFLLPFTFYLLVSINFFRQQNEKLQDSFTKRNWWSLVAPLLIIVSFSVLFLYVVKSDPTFAPGGYLGSKMSLARGFSLAEVPLRFFQNAYKNILAFYKEGDIVFRWNVSRSPHVDFLSGFFLALGLVRLLLGKRKDFLYIIIPLLLLPILSLSPTHPVVEIPSSPRTNCIIPFIFLLIANGVDFCCSLFDRFSRKFSRIFLISSLSLIFALNFYKYFFIYPNGLPNRNIPFGRIIANYLNTLPRDTLMLLPSCCWGDWGQPEVDSVYYGLRSDKRVNFYSLPISSCQELSYDDIVIIVNPNDKGTIGFFEDCIPGAKFFIYGEGEEKIFASIYKIK